MTRQCASCENPISEKRLAALPNAALCIECQESKCEPICSVPATNMARLGFTRMVKNDPYLPVRKHRIQLSTHGLGAA